MLKELVVMAVVPLMLSDTTVGAVPIGTASARGDMRIDSSRVNGTATVFNGSIIETGQAGVALRLKRGIEVTMSSSSRGILYQDHFVLQQGQSEMTASPQFQLEAKGLHVTPSSASARGVISMKAGNTVEVDAVTGSFGVKNDQGILLASVQPGEPLSFAMQAAGSAAFSGSGKLSEEGGHYFVTVNGVKYEVVGKNLAKDVGKTVKFTGNIAAGAAPDAGATAVITLTSAKVVGGILVGTAGTVVAGTAIGLGAGLGVGYAVANATQSSPSTP